MRSTRTRGKGRSSSMYSPYYNIKKYDCEEKNNIFFAYFNFVTILPKTERVLKQNDAKKCRKSHIPPNEMRLCGVLNKKSPPTGGVKTRLLPTVRGDILKDGARFTRRI